MDVFCVFCLVVVTPQVEFSKCCVWFQCFTQRCCSFFSYIVPCWCEEKWKEWIVDGCLLCVFFSSLLKLSWVSVVFVFNTSLNDAAPVSLILLSVDVVKRDMCNYLIDIFRVLFLCSPLRSSWVSAVFDFNASLRTSAPLAPISMPVSEKRKGKCDLWMFLCVFYFVFTTQTERSECCVCFQCFTQWRYPD